MLELALVALAVSEQLVGDRVEKLWPTPSFEIPSTTSSRGAPWRACVLAAVLALREQEGGIKVRKSNRGGGWQSADTLLRFPLDWGAFPLGFGAAADAPTEQPPSLAWCFARLKLEVYGAVYAAVAATGGGDGQRVAIDGCWANVNGDSGAWNLPHTHPRDHAYILAAHRYRVLPQSKL